MLSFHCCIFFNRVFSFFFQQVLCLFPTQFLIFLNIEELLSCRLCHQMQAFAFARLIFKELMTVSLPQPLNSLHLYSLIHCLSRSVTHVCIYSCKCCFIFLFFLNMHVRCICRGWLQSNIHFNRIRLISALMNSPVCWAAPFSPSQQDLNFSAVICSGVCCDDQTPPQRE